MKTLTLFLALCATAAGQQPVGFARSANFVVYAPPQTFANEVLANAERYRGEIAREWFGRELPNGAGRTVIYVDLDPTEDDGLTMANDHPGRNFHNIWLTTSKRNASGATLKHEICHSVFATFHSSPRVPKELEERCALTYNAPRHGDAAGLRSRLRQWEVKK